MLMGAAQQWRHGLPWHVPQSGASAQRGVDRFDPHGQKLSHSGQSASASGANRNTRVHRRDRPVMAASGTNVKADKRCTASQSRSRITDKHSEPVGFVDCWRCAGQNSSSTSTSRKPRSAPQSAWRFPSSTRSQDDDHVIFMWMRIALIWQRLLPFSLDFIDSLPTVHSG